MAHQRIVGDYVLTHKIGAGSFAEVWKAKHRHDGNEVAIKEIATEKLNKKLQENLMSEIAILKSTNHPNIIRLYDIVMGSHRIFLILEYCAGGDLAAYIQQRGRAPEAVARHFMRELGAGLQVLRVNNLVHRDLKPQNLLLSSNDGHVVLKIADFGFARYLQPQGMAETLCGSPLYMAPEILQLKKYDAKADLWSVGAILYQLVTGQTPFLGQSPAQLLRNIEKSNDVQFPTAILADLHPECVDLCRRLLRRNPVERLSFEEFFKHSFIAEPIRHESKGFGNPTSKGTDSSISMRSQEDSLPILLDEDPQSISASPSTSKQQLLAVSPSFSFLQSTGERTSVRNSAAKRDVLLKEKGGSFSPCMTGREIPSKQLLDTNFRSEKGAGSKFVAAEGVPFSPDGEQGSFQTSSLKGALMDSMECLEEEYVLVNALLASTETISSSASDQSTYVGHHSLSKNPQKSCAVKVPSLEPSRIVPLGFPASVERHCSPSEFSQGSTESADRAELSSIHSPTRLQSLRNCARAIAELSRNKLGEEKHLEALSVQLACLATWKEAINVCHKWANASSGFSAHFRDEIGSIDAFEDTQSSRIALPFFETFDEGVAAAWSHVDQQFLLAVEYAEGLAPHLRSLDGNAEIPDAMEIIFQSALTTGRNAGVDELMGNIAIAAEAYSKAAILMYFLRFEAASLPLTPHFVLSASDRRRLNVYIDGLKVRHGQCASGSSVEPGRII